MSDRPDDISKEAWEAAHVVNVDQLWAWIPDDMDDKKLYQDTASIARAIMRARREGYAAGVRAAAEVAECDCCDVCGESPGYPKCANEIASAIRALDGKVYGNG